MKRLRMFSRACLAATVLFFGVLTDAALAAAPTINFSNLQVRTLDDGVVVVFPLVTVTDTDGIGTITATVEQTTDGIGPFPLSVSRFVAPNDSATRDSFFVNIQDIFIPVTERDGNYDIVVSDGTTTITTTESLPVLTPLPPAGAVTINTTTGLLTPTVSISPVPGATHYRVSIVNDTDEVSETFDGVPGGTLSTNTSFQIPLTIGGRPVLEAGKFYRIRIQAFNASTNGASTLRSDSEDTCYDPSTGTPNPPCFPNGTIHLRTRANGQVDVRPIVRVRDLDGFPGVPIGPSPLDTVTVGRPSVFGPFEIVRSGYALVDIVNSDSSTLDSFRRPFQATGDPGDNIITEAQRPGAYLFTATDSLSTTTLTRTLPSGLTPFPAGGPVTIDDSTGALTPTVSAPLIPGASFYRLIIFNDTDNEIILFDGVPGNRLATTPNFLVLPGLLEAGKRYRLRVDGFDKPSFFASNIRSQGPITAYDPSNLDPDDDGIDDAIDDNPGVASDSFTNNAPAVPVSGIRTVTSGSPNAITIANPADPTTGVSVSVDSGSGTISACGLGTIQVTSGDAFLLSCGPLNVQVFAGALQIELPGDIVANIPNGSITTVEETAPGQVSVENDGVSFDPVTLEIEGEEVVVEPGEPSVTVINVPIDIDPESRKNIIDITSDDSIKVGILSTSDFNAPNEVDRATVTFGRTGTEATATKCWRTRVNRDSKKDLVCSFRIRDTGFEKGDTVGVLKGRTKTAQFIQGTDDVKIVMDDDDDSDDDDSESGAGGGDDDSS